MAHGAEEIQAFTRKCVMVFAALMALTIVTVAVSYLDLSTPAAIAVGLAVALTKGSLVALFFMHLIDEKKVIYYTLALAAGFFAMLMYLPTGWHTDLVRADESVWTVLPHEGAPEGGHHGGHEGHDDHGDDHGDEHH